MNRIIITEDNEFIGDGLNSIFTSEGYEVKLCHNISEAKNEILHESPDMLVLDVMLPDGNGFDFCSELRKKYDFPILFLTCCDEEYNVVRGLDAGGDDYVVKPFRVQELLSRTRALLRRKSGCNVDNRVINCGNIKIDVDKRYVYKDGKDILFTPNEFNILYKLMSNLGIVVTRQKLLSDIWDADERFVDDNTVSVNISNIRKKLGECCLVIETIRGVGYRAKEAE